MKNTLLNFLNPLMSSLGNVVSTNGKNCNVHMQGLPKTLPRCCCVIAILIYYYFVDI